MAKIIMTIEAESICELRGALNGWVSTPSEPIQEFVVAKGAHVPSAEIENTTAEQKPVQRRRSPAAKPAAANEDRAPEGVMSPDAPVAKQEPNITLEAFVDTMQGIRAKYGEDVVPELRVILKKYGYTKASEVVVKDAPAIVADLKTLDAKLSAPKEEGIF